jgi:hypothetical protein
MTVTEYLTESVVLTEEFLALVKKLQSASPPLRDGDPELIHLRARHKDIARQMVELTERFERGRPK